MAKRALITGVTGQDGSYLAESLLGKGYEVHGIKRRASSFNTVRVDHLYQDPHDAGRRFFRLFSHYVGAYDMLTRELEVVAVDRKAFLAWVGRVDDLTDAQRVDAMAVLGGRPHEGAAAAIELAFGDDRQCPHCQTPGAENRGMARGLRRYRCKACGKSFNALSGTSLSRLRHKDRWLAFGESLAKGETIAQGAARCGVAHATAFRWRHRFLKAAKPANNMLGGIVEADETFVLSSRKGSLEWKRSRTGQSITGKPDREARRRGGKAAKRGLSHELVPVLVAADRSGTTISAVLPAANGDAIKAVLDPVLSQDALLVTDGGKALASCATKMMVTHEVLNQSAGERVRGDLHIQTVNSRHERLKTFLRIHRGVSTKYLTNYLNWFHLAVLPKNPTARGCLNAAIAAYPPT